jgi:LPS-assembly lipoprotein
VSSPYATLVALQDAQRRGAQDIAERIRIELSVYLANHPAELSAK